MFFSLPFSTVFILKNFALLCSIASEWKIRKILCTKKITFEYKFILVGRVALHCAAPARVAMETRSSAPYSSSYMCT